MRDEVLCALPFFELYSRLIVHFRSNHFNVLLLAALVQAAAMDVVFADCGAPRLLPCLKREELNKAKMLMFLVGRAWQHLSAQDASPISVECLVDEWMVA